MSNTKYPLPAGWREVMTLGVCLDKTTIELLAKNLPGISLRFATISGKPYVPPGWLGNFLDSSAPNTEDRKFEQIFVAKGVACKAIFDKCHEYLKSGGSIIKMER